MENQLEKSLYQLQTLAINIDEMEELINPNKRVKVAYDLLIRSIYRMHVEDARALQTYFKEDFYPMIQEIIIRVENLLMKYCQFVPAKYQWIYKIYDALIRAAGFVLDLRLVRKIKS